MDVEIRKGKKNIVVKALVDSGASFSVFRHEVAEFLDIKIENGHAVYLEGIGGRILGYMHRLPVVIAGKKIVGKIVFSKEFHVSLNIIGRNNLFQPFWITFKEKEKSIEVTPCNP